MPAVPEVTDVACQEGAVEVFWRMNAQEVAERDGKGAIAGEIKEQIKTVGIHVAHQGAESGFWGDTIQPILFDQSGEDEFVKKSAKDAVHCCVQIDHELITRSFFS